MTTTADIAEPAIEPIPVPPDPEPGQRQEGCLHIVADVAEGSWRYCQRPVHQGAWCAPHYAACHRWPGIRERQKLGEEIVRILRGERIDGDA